MSDIKSFISDGRLVNTIATQSEEYPYDKTVTCIRALLYIDWI